MASISFDHKTSEDEFGVDFSTTQRAKASTAPVQPPGILRPTPKTTQPQQQKQQETQQEAEIRADVTSLAESVYIHDLLHDHSIGLDHKYDSLTAGQPDPVEIWIPSSRYNPATRQWDRPVTTQYLLNTLSAVHKLIPHHIGPYYSPPIIGEVDFGAVNPITNRTGEGNRFYCLNNLDYNIESTSYTNTSNTPLQRNITRASGHIPHLERSSGLIDTTLVNLFSSDPDAINPKLIDRSLAPFPVESSLISLSNLDVVPVTVHNKQKTTTTTTHVDPRTGLPRDSNTIVQTKELPDTVKWARGTSLQRLYDTRNSGLVPTLTPGPHNHNLTRVPINTTRLDRNIEPTIIISNPISNEKLTLTGHNASINGHDHNNNGNNHNISDQLTQAEINSISDAICIYRNRNMYRYGNNPHRLAQEFISNISGEILEHVRSDINRQYDHEITSIRKNVSQQKKSLQDTIKIHENDAAQAYKEKQSVLNAAIADLELQAREAQKRLAASTKESSREEQSFHNELNSRVKGLENELKQLRTSASQWQNELSSNRDPAQIDRDYNNKYEQIMQKYNNAVDLLKREWNDIEKNMKNDETNWSTRLQQLNNDKRQWDNDYNQNKQQLILLSNQTTSLLQQYNQSVKERNDVVNQRDIKLQQYNKDLQQRSQQFETQLLNKKQNVIRQEDIVKNLKDKLTKQRTLMTTRIEEARNKLSTIELEGCYEIPGKNEVVETKVPITETKYEKVHVQKPVTVESVHYEIVSDPLLVNDSNNNTTINNNNRDRTTTTTRAISTDGTTTTTTTSSSQNKSNRGWFGSMADAARDFLRNMNNDTTTLLPTLNHSNNNTTNAVDNNDPNIVSSSNNHIYGQDGFFRNYDSIIGTTDDDDDDDNDTYRSYERYAALTDCDE